MLYGSRNSSSRKNSDKFLDRVYHYFYFKEQIKSIILMNSFILILLIESNKINMYTNECFKVTKLDIISPII